MGLFEFAHKGTLFLDEIGDMPVTLQAKLLRVLQERRFRPVGGREEIEVDIRIIAATNTDLSEAIRQKTFRSDLFYRLNVVTLHLPSLRERLEDIPLLANFFLQQFTKDNQCAVTSISPEALDLLQIYPWPGNVRELQNVIEHATTLACDAEICVSDLPKSLRSLAPLPPKTNGAVPIPSQIDNPPGINPQRPGKEHLFPAKSTIVGDFERKYITRLLVQNGFNISKAAEAAGCHRRTLYRMVHRYQIDLAWLQKERGVIRQNRRQKANKLQP